MGICQWPGRKEGQIALFPLAQEASKELLGLYMPWHGSAHREGSVAQKGHPGEWQP